MVAACLFCDPSCHHQATMVLSSHLRGTHRSWVQSSSFFSLIPQSRDVSEFLMVLICKLLYPYFYQLFSVTPSPVQFPALSLLSCKILKRIMFCWLDPSWTSIISQLNINRKILSLTSLSLAVAEEVLWRLLYILNDSNHTFTIKITVLNNPIKLKLMGL